MTADCVPIIFYDQINNTIGCVHAGWKGAFSGIIENLIDKLIGINKKFKITASVGPCIQQKKLVKTITVFLKILLMMIRKMNFYLKKKIQKNSFLT